MRLHNNLSMLTDFYEFTMANGYLKAGIADTTAYFDMFFRKIPDGGGYAIMAGVEQLVDYLKNLKFDKDDIEFNNRLSLLSYLGILVLIPLFLVKYSRYSRFHANQGILLIIYNLLIGVITWVIRAVLGLIGTGIVWVMGKIASRVLFLLKVGGFIAGALSVLGWVLTVLISATAIFLMVVGIINAVKGRAKELPLIGRIKLIK